MMRQVSILIGATLFSVGCGSPSGASKNSQSNPLSAPDTCNEWHLNNPSHLASSFADFEGGGAVLVNADAKATISFSGELSGYSIVNRKIESPIPTAVIFSRSIKNSDFEISFQLEGVDSSSKDLAFFFGIESVASGRRDVLTEMIDGTISTGLVSWHDSGLDTSLDVDMNDSISGVSSSQPITVSIRRVGQVIYRDFTGRFLSSDLGYPFSGDLNFVMGIQNRSDVGAKVSGSITATVSNFRITTTSRMCQANSF